MTNPYVHQHFPKYLYHPTQAPQGRCFASVVEFQDQSGDRAGWVETPADFPPALPVDECSTPPVHDGPALQAALTALQAEHENLQAIAAAQGQELDRLRAELEAAKAAKGKKPAKGDAQ